MASSVRSNLPDVLAGIESLPHVLDFDRPFRGSGRTLGDEAADVVVEQTRARTLDRQQDADGNPLTPNQGRYGAQKRSQGIPVLVGLIDGGEMLDGLKGDVGITPTSVIVELGATAAIQDKIAWAVEGDESRNRAPRDIVGIDSEMDDALDELMIQALDSALGFGGNA